MALLPILQFPDPKLKLVAEPVSVFDAELKQLCADMIETMYESQGVGLAATQIDVQKRIFVCDVSRDESDPLVIINPTFTKEEGEIIWEEGCLSFPGVYAKIKRFSEVSIEYYDADGKKQTLENAEKLLSVCIQHEIDHLDGITFFDHLSKMKQGMLLKKLQKSRDRTL